MNIKLDSQNFLDVKVPVLWGQRAIVQDAQDRLSVLDFSSDKANLEILGDKPAPGISFVPTFDGFNVLADGGPLYEYRPGEKTLISISLGLQDCQIGTYTIRVGTNTISGGILSGY